MDSLEMEDNVSVCETLSMTRLITPDSQRSQTSRRVVVCLALLCAVLLAGNIGQTVNYAMKIRPVLADLNQGQHRARQQAERPQIQNDTLTKTHFDALVTRLSNLTREKDQLQTSYNALAKEKEELESDRLALTTERNQFKASVTNLTGENDQLKESYDILKQTSHQLQMSYKALQADRGALTESKDRLQNNYAALQTEKDELQTRLSTAEANSDQFRLLFSNYSSLRREKERLQRQYDYLNLQRDSLETSFNSLLKARGALQYNFNNIQRQNQQLQTSRDQLEKAVNGMEAKIRGMNCQTGWRKFGISCYFTSESKKNWTESRKACDAEGSDLVVINSGDEQAFVNSLLNSGENAWIGLTDSLTEGEWKWVDGTPLTTAYWQPGQPNNKYTEQDCGEIVHNSPVGNWNDDGCFSEQIWICEK